ncbi:MAG: SDR family oxidoreductase [Elusimicrobia bacterium]|nr:SDR family oxidoreductase [Elusimicrobiota bacterium]
MNLEGKVVLVTGAGRRVGRTIALAFAAKGARVAVHYNTSAAEARRVADAVKSLSGADADTFRANLSDPKAPEKLADAVSRRFGRLDALINSASLYEKTPFSLATPEDWERHMAVNARAPFFLAQACAPHLRRSGEGLVVNIADWAGHRPYSDYGPYCASKAALLCVNKILAKALAPDVRVNAILPGPVLAPAGMSEHEKKKMAEATLLKRLGTPEAVARACLFLAESADFSTGAELTVDGGRLIA